jgi:hypothetical protein
MRHSPRKPAARLALSVLTVLLVAGGAEAQLGREQDTDRQGADYRFIDRLSADECWNECVYDLKCRAYTWSPNPSLKDWLNRLVGGCWLKDGVPRPTPRPNMMSGVKRVITYRPPVTDHDTRRLEMHRCPVGLFMTGIHRGNELLLCEWFGGSSGELIDSGPGPYTHHTCPEGYAMTGLHIGRDQLACAQLAVGGNGYGLGGPNPMRTRFGMGACDEGDVMVGYSADRNEILCRHVAVTWQSK